ncbi:MAG: HlyD family efflux transporter periplasmic adaptor subunit [Planctomycetales bacterium]|nr:HlyD family efflux transporter periplasmic adaptor subunit [Planctomycetales bacterium]
MIATDSKRQDITAPLPLRVRPDVRVHPVRLRGRWHWNVKDPATQRYFQLRDEEYFVWRHLDGTHGFAEIQKRFDCQFAPQRLATEELRAFVTMLDTAGLLLVDAAGQGERMWRRRLSHQQRERWAGWTNPLMIRFRGLNPEPLLRWLTPRLRWSWSASGCAVATLVIVSAVLLAVAGWEDIIARLPGTQSFLTPGNVFWLGVTLAGIKLLHELGHAVTCHRFGGECHELGVMLLVFTPTLYCNVSDSWMLPSKWQRAAIASAGVAVEIVLAAVATWLWWLSEPGLFHTICLNVMLVGSINTLVFNGNPLLRFDGYYVLSDLLEVPNLREQADAAARDVMIRGLCGRNAASVVLDASLPRTWLIGYGVAAWAYRWTVLFGIFWFLHRMLMPIGLEWIVLTLAVPIVGRAVVNQVSRGMQIVRETVHGDDTSRARMRMRGGVVFAALASLFLIPLPCSVVSPAVVEPRGTQSLYVSISGRIVDSVRDGAAVEAGQAIVRLDNPELERDIVRLIGQRNQQRRHVESLRRRQVSDSHAAAGIPAAMGSLADLEERLNQRERDLSRLTLTAPAAGTILSAVSRFHSGSPDGLRSWSGRPLDDRNRGALLDTGTLVCRIGDPLQREALLFVVQDDIEFVRPGQRVRMQFDALPSATLAGTVAEISAVDEPSIPWPLVARGDLPVTSDHYGQARPLVTVYQARVEIETHDHDLPLGSTGQARVRVEPMSLGSRMLRAARRTFRFEM